MTVQVGQHLDIDGTWARVLRLLLKCRECPTPKHCELRTNTTSTTLHTVPHSAHPDIRTAGGRLNDVMDTIIKAIANHSRTALVTTSTTNRYVHSTTITVCCCNRLTSSYGALLHRAASIAADLLRNPLVGAVDARPGASVGARIALLLPPGPDYVAATWAAWLTGSTAVPLCTDHPHECVD